MLAIVFQDKKITFEFVEVYHSLLKTFPDHAIDAAVRECLLNCRFFPTIAEIKERAITNLQKYNLENRKALTDDAYSKCPENCYRDKDNMPRCRLEDSNPGACALSGDGRCGKWKDELFWNKNGT